MNSKEFIIWLGGFMDAIDGIPTQAQWDLLKSKLSEVRGEPTTSFPFGTPNTIPSGPIPRTPFEPYKPTPNPYIGGNPNIEVRYGDICPCNPANGGSGICGCVMANEIVKPHTNQSIASTGTVIIDGFIQNSSITNKYPDDVTLTYSSGSGGPVSYSIGDSKKNKKGK